MSLNKYINKDLIVWNYINEQQETRCYVYPKCIIGEDDRISYVSSDDFPESGAIQVLLTQGTTYEYIEEFGEIFVMTVNQSLLENTNLSSSNKYIARANSLYNDRNRNDVTFSDVSRFGLREVIETYWRIEEVIEKREIPADWTYTKEIFVKAGDRFFGPFEASTDDSKSGIVKLSSLAENKDYIGEFLEQDIQEYVAEIADSDESLVRTFISLCGTSDILSLANEKIDFISDEKLIENMGTILSISDNTIIGLDKYTLNKIKETLIKSFKEKQTVLLTEDRLNRLLNIIDKMEVLPKSLYRISKEIIDNEQLRQEMIQYVIDSQSDYLFDSIANDDKMAQLITNMLIESGRMAIPTESNDLLLNELNTIKEEKVKLENENDSLKNSLTKKIESTEPSDGNIEKINALKKEYQDYREKVDETKLEYETLVSYKQSVTESLHKIVEDFKNDATVIGKTADKFFLQEVISTIEGIDHESNYDVPTCDAAFISEFDCADTVIDRVEEYIVNKSNRVMSRYEIINLLICITNGFITTFAGNPGTGKTSLCNILAKALGLTRSDSSKRFVQVAVERGWTSQKDYIGYYNPLSKRFEITNYEMMNALRTLDYEADSNNLAAPYLVLLDEANLSPIEHYWAAFNRISDLSNSDRTITLGGSKVWKISSNMRFLATINFDHTTEELSPRFLDRTWIIVLKANAMDVSMANNDENITNMDTIVSMNSLREYFMPKQGEEINEVIKSKLNEVVRAFEESELPISQRNMIMVRDYCIVAQKYMIEGKFSALDFAISQKILPTINGYGSKYDRLLSELTTICERTLPMCSTIIKKMRDNADDLAGNYQFF